MNRLVIVGLVALAACGQPTAPRACDTVAGARVYVTHYSTGGVYTDTLTLYYDTCARHWLTDSTHSAP